MSRLDRLREYMRMDGPDGCSRAESNLTYWSDRASENSLHPNRRSKPRLGGPGRSDKNHVGESDFMPNVRRIGS
ncbi:MULTISPECIES: hypothetical protein [unclassified Bradyrhizobium]|uniref:hypothetical protein n=1 Tax=unclassified Bradyrhizobium TaxID=2631580 RepID=UPI0028EC3685|nr:MULTISPECIES: hypothetical protein [unclassified Bradyrhizobium]